MSTNYKKTSFLTRNCTAIGNLFKNLDRFHGLICIYPPNGKHLIFLRPLFPGQMEYQYLTVVEIFFMLH